MWWRADLHDLHRISDRISTLYVEHTHVDRAENAIVLINKERTVRVPAAFLVILLLGPGTRVTHGAMNLLGDSATGVAWVGEHGVRYYAGGPTPTTGTRLLQRQAQLVTNRNERLRIARLMYAQRFPGEDVSNLTMQQLRGREGVRVRRLYEHHAQRTGVPWKKRDYVPGDAFASGDDVNRCLSAANACLYGICHAVIAGLGASPGLGFIHTGGSTSFVNDLADLYKAEFTIPLAFELVAAGTVDEPDVRRAFRDQLKDGRLLHRIIADLTKLLAPDDEREADRLDRNELWDERDGTVPGNTRYGMQHLTVTGPAVTPQAHG
jgi:CRISP-associated protein Cas1